MRYNVKSRAVYLQHVVASPDGEVCGSLFLHLLFPSSKKQVSLWVVVVGEFHNPNGFDRLSD